MGKSKGENLTDSSSDVKTAERADKPKSKPSTDSSSSSSSSSRGWDTIKPKLSDWLLEAMATMGFSQMTPVQASSIPLFLGNKDVVVEAVTGSGKTLSFLIPVIERILKMDEVVKKHHVASVIVCPTRELATQIHEVIQSVLTFHPPSAKVMNLAKPQPLPNLDEDSDEEAEDAREAEVAEHVYGSMVPKVVPQLVLGGVSTPAGDLRQFVKWSPNVLIGTPGRLLSLLQSMHVHTPQSCFDTLVLDEADRLLALGFKDELRGILEALPKQRRTGLFSASVTDAVGDLVRAGLRNPVKIAVKVKSSSGKLDKRTPASLEMRYAAVPPDERIAATVKMLVDAQAQKSIVYVSTCAAVDYLSHVLPLLVSDPFFYQNSIKPVTKKTAALRVIPLHGKLTPAARTKNFEAFKSLNNPLPVVLLTTDVAARGLDVPEVDLVVQMDPPADPSAFMHRAGRAGRAGRIGKAVLFLSPGREEDYVPFLAIRGTPVIQQPYESIPQEVLTRTRTLVRKAQLGDRDTLDKGQRGFVSWVRSYAKHETSSIFRISDIDWAAHIRAWGLLRMPDMPESRSWLSQVVKDATNGAETAGEAEAEKEEGGKRPRRVHPNEHPAVLTLLGLPDPGLDLPTTYLSSTTTSSPTTTTAIDLKTIPYAHPVREAKRQRLIQENGGNTTVSQTNSAAATAAGVENRKRKNKEEDENGWSGNKDRKMVREVRRDAQSAKRDKVRESGLSVEEKEKKEEVKRLIEQVRRAVAEGSFGAAPVQESADGQKVVPVVAAPATRSACAKAKKKARKIVQR